MIQGYWVFVGIVFSFVMGLVYSHFTVVITMGKWIEGLKHTVAMLESGCLRE